jgi:hypothetical protein
MATPKSGSSKGNAGGRKATRKAKRKTTRKRPAAAEPVRARSDSGIVEADEIAPPRATFSTGRASERATNVTKRAAGAAATAARDASRRVISATPSIVLKATSIIEEEVAMGIGAAKRIEQRFLDVEALRSQDPDHVMSRFRKDAHEAVDIILDIVTAAASTVGERAGKIVNVTASHLAEGNASRSHQSDGEPGSANAGITRLPTVRMPGTVAPGKNAELTMSLENDSDTATAEFTLHSSELVSAGGARIPASAVMFKPATLAVGPRAAGRVAVRVRVPKDAKPGSYEGLLRATQLDGLRAMLAVNVG